MTFKPYSSMFTWFIVESIKMGLGLAEGMAVTTGPKMVSKFLGDILAKRR